MMIARKLLLTFVLLLWCGCLWVVSVPVRQAFSHTYHHWLADIGGGSSRMQLPALTAYVAVPIIGDELHLRTGPRSPLFYIYWSLLWVGPVVVGVAVWIICEPQRLAEFWIYSVSIYGSIVLFSAGLIAVGLWIPFALL